MKYLMLLLLMLAGFAACKKEQPKLNDAQNACDCLVQQRTTFLMGEKILNQFNDLDTIAVPIDYVDGNPANFIYDNPVSVQFSSNNPDALSYKWIIGANQPNIKTEKEFSLWFGGALGTIPIMLITKSKTNKNCIPNDDGYDTILRYLSLLNIEPHPLAGTYFGSNNNATAEGFEIEIDTFRSVVNTTNIFFGVKNLPEGNTFDRFVTFGTTYFQAISESGGVNNYVQFQSNGKNRGIYRKESRTIDIDYSAYYLDNNYNIISSLDNVRFTGIKN